MSFQKSLAEKKGEAHEDGPDDRRPALDEKRVEDEEDDQEDAGRPPRDPNEPQEPEQEEAR